MAKGTEKPQVTKVEFDFSDDAKDFLRSLFSKEEPKKSDTPKKTTIKEENSTSSSNVSLSEIRAMVVDKADAGKQAGIKKLLEFYGYKTVAMLPEENYNDFYKDLSKV